MKQLNVLLWALAACECCSGQVQFPEYKYSVPAIAEVGGPVYVIPGTATEKTLIAFTASGVACVKSDPTICTNAAGLTTIGYRGVGYKDTVSATIGGVSGSWDVGSLVISIEGVDTREVFKMPATPGVSPATSLSLPASTTFHDLGFSPFTVQNAHIKFFVADDYYPDNTGSFLLTLVSPTLTYNTAAPSKKIIQMVGPCDWQTWVPGVTCDPTGASPDPSQVLGMDLGFSFEDKLSKRLVFLFGDTIGVQIPNGLSLTPALRSPSQFPQFDASDAFANSAPQFSTLQPRIDFVQHAGSTGGIPNSPFFVKPTNQPLPPPNGTPVAMGANDTPGSGIQVDGQNYIVVGTGINPALSDPRACQYSVLVKYDAGNPSGNLNNFAPPTFTSGRTISQASLFIDGVCTLIPTGHFVYVSPHELPVSYSTQIGLGEPAVLLFGNGHYRNESIYLSIIAANQFWAGVDDKGNPSTTYFAGLDGNGQPTWTANESCAVPVVYDNPLGTALTLTGGGTCINTLGEAYSLYNDPGTAGQVSVSYNSELALWLMTWDGGRQPHPLSNIPISGIYFSYASAPWGPWSRPQPIYEPCSAHLSYAGEGFGDFIHYAYQGKSGSSDDICSAITQIASNMGPAGPIIGAKSTSGEPDPFQGETANPAETALSRRGTVYAPFQIARLAAVDGAELSIYYNMSTWNPYTVVLMQSNFSIAPPVFAFP